MTWVLLWSQRQNALHVEPADRMLKSNREAFDSGRACDYIPVDQGTQAEMQATADAHRAVIQARAMTRKALDRAARSCDWKDAL